MSDDLIKHLRSPISAMRPTLSDGRAAADRIEELEAGLQKMALEYLDAASKSYQAQLKAEAKLAKAVGALDAFIRLDDDYSPFGGELLQDRVEWTWKNARATLAELKGKTDE
jgi:hypothetical protein